MSCLKSVLEFAILLFYSCVILPYKGKRMHKICQRITLYNPGLTVFLMKQDKAETKCSGIIGLLFGVSSIIRAKISLHNSKYPCVLSTKPPNVVYML